jgi:hypothetical protein
MHELLDTLEAQIQKLASVSKPYAEFVHQDVCCLLSAQAGLLLLALNPYSSNLALLDCGGNCGGQIYRFDEFGSSSVVYPKTERISNVRSRLTERFAPGVTTRHLRHLDCPCA